MNSSPLHMTQPQLPVHGPIKVQSQATDRLEPDAPDCSPGGFNAHTDPSQTRNDPPPRGVLIALSHDVGP